MAGKHAHYEPWFASINHQLYQRDWFVCNMYIHPLKGIRKRNSCVPSAGKEDVHLHKLSQKTNKHRTIGYEPLVIFDICILLIDLNFLQKTLVSEVGINSGSCSSILGQYGDESNGFSAAVMLALRKGIVRSWGPNCDTVQGIFATLWKCMSQTLSKSERYNVTQRSAPMASNSTHQHPSGQSALDSWSLVLYSARLQRVTTCSKSCLKSWSLGLNSQPNALT